MSQLSAEPARPAGRWLVPAISLAYLLFSRFLIGFRPEQLVLVGLCNACYFLSATTRRFITGFSIFVVFWVPNVKYIEVKGWNAATREPVIERLSV